MKRILCLVLVVLTASLAFASDGLFVQSGLYPDAETYSYERQLRLPSGTPSIPTDNVLEALGRPDYPVTPGDVYTLSYTEGKEPVRLTIQVGTDFKAVVSTFGTVNAEGMTYLDLKKAVENLVLTYNRYALPDLSLTSCGIFSVKVSGEVNYSSYVKVWGLSRLSDLASYATAYASTRTVKVISRDGSSSSYDLYKGVNEGVEGQNPMLKPGDEVIFLPAQKTVTLTGAVKKGGVYQPASNETLADLIEVYGSGAKNSASDVITVSNYTDGVYTATTLSLAEASSYVMKDGDSVFVSSSSQALPFVTVEGAVSSLDKNGESTGKFFYNYFPGETAEEMLRAISSSLLSTSDTAGIYIQRGEEKIPVAAEAALTGSTKGETVLQQGDTLVVPFTQLFVTVNGAVNRPGVFSYIPDRTSDYYIALAGGFSDAANVSHSSTVLDKNGEKLKKVNFIPSESTITVPKDSFKLNLATTVTLVGLVASVVSIAYNCVSLTLAARNL